MASSGSFQSNTGVNCNIKVSWKQTKNVSANTSTIDVSVYLVHNSIYIGSTSMNIVCMGQTKNVSTPAISTTAAGKTTLIGSASFTVAHNNDGTKSGSISATIPNFGVTYSGVYLASLSASSTVALDSIPRASIFTVSTSSANMGEQISFSISRASSSYTHKLIYVLPNSDINLTGTDGEIGSGIGVSKQWTIPLEFANYTANATENTLIIGCETYNGSTLIGTTSLSIKVKVPTSIVPSIDSVTVKPSSANSVVSGWGIFVQNYCKALCSISAAGAYKSTIKSYAVTYGGDSVTSSTNSISTSKILTGTSNNIIVKVTDTRGRTATKTITVSTYQYNIPSLTNIKCFRCDSEGIADEEGTYLYINATKSFASCNGKNTATVNYTVKKKSDGSSVASGTVNNGDNMLDILSATNVYVVTLKITDSLGNSKSYFYDITTVSVAFNLYPSKKGGAAFGKYAEKEETLDIGEWGFICGEAKTVQGMYVHDTGLNNWGTAGYIVLARLEVKGNWLSNEQIRFDVKGLTQSGEIIIVFSNTGTVTATTVSSFTRTGNLPPMYYVLTVGTNTVTVEIIAYKQTYQDFVIVNYKCGANIKNKVAIAFPNRFESSLRDGAIQAIEGTTYGQIIHAVKEARSAGDVIAGYGASNQASLLQVARGIVKGGSEKDFLVRITAQNLTFNSSGVATFDMSNYLTASGGTSFNGMVLAQFRKSIATVVTGAHIEGTTLIVQAYNISTSTVFSGTGQVDVLYIINM